MAVCILCDFKLAHCEKPNPLMTFIKKQLQPIAELHGYLKELITVEAKNKLTKKLKSKNWRKKFCRGFQKL